MKSSIIIFLGFICLFCEKRQMKINDSVPSNYLNKYQISSVKREKIKSTIKSLKDITIYLPNNYVKDGSEDYTKALQRGIDNNENVILPNFPILINDKGLLLRSNTIIVFNKNSALKKMTTNKSNYDILKISGVKNIKVYFANIIGDRYNHGGKDGEWGMGIGIWNSENIQIEIPRIKYCWGDGIYINHSNMITINKPFLNNNRRNGLSIISGTNITVDSLLATNHDGTAPKAGIDIEPNNNYEELKNIIINNPITYNNTQGVLIALEAMNGKTSKNMKITINNHTDDSSDYSLGLYVNKNRLNDAFLIGTIDIINSKWINTKKENILFNKKENTNKNRIKINISNITPSLDNKTKNKILELNSY